jgi:hypothetical protein
MGARLGRLLRGDLLLQPAVAIDLPRGELSVSSPPFPVACTTAAPPRVHHRRRIRSGPSDFRPKAACSPAACLVPYRQAPHGGACQHISRVLHVQIWAGSGLPWVSARIVFPFLFLQISARLYPVAFNPPKIL